MLTQTNTQSVVWDVAVIGGGPAGMMAAIEAGARGKKVVLIEKNPVLGKKLLITGGGRCNVTNNKPVVREMLRQYKDAGKFLFSTFMQHGVQETIEFFARYNVPFIEENEGRLFPYTEKAESVCTVLKQALKEQAVTILTGKKVVSLLKTDTLFTVKMAHADDVKAHKIVVAAGGTARPETGSTGDGYPWFTQLGHTVHVGSTSLVPITVREDWITTLGGVSLSEATLSIYCNGTKRHKATGKLLFTHVGLSGPLILNQSKLIGDLLTEGDVVIKIDLTNTIDASEIQAQLLQAFRATPNKKVKNVLSDFIKTALVAPFLESLMLNGDSQVNAITAVDRKRIGVTLKAWPLTVSGLLGPDKAVATAGGVDLKEVDFKTMQSKIVPGLYLVGDVLNINRPSGGYSLQLAWSTGYVAGKHV